MTIEQTLVDNSVKLEPISKSRQAHASDGEEVADAMVVAFEDIYGGVSLSKQSLVEGVNLDSDSLVLNFNDEVTAIKAVADKKDDNATNYADIGIAALDHEKTMAGVLHGSKEYKDLPGYADVPRVRDLQDDYGSAKAQIAKAKERLNNLKADFKASPTIKALLTKDQLFADDIKQVFTTIGKVLKDNGFKSAFVDENPGYYILSSTLNKSRFDEKTAPLIYASLIQDAGLDEKAKFSIVQVAESHLGSGSIYFIRGRDDGKTIDWDFNQEGKLYGAEIPQGFYTDEHKIPEEHISDRVTQRQMLSDYMVEFNKDFLAIEEYKNRKGNLLSLVGYNLAIKNNPDNHLAHIDRSKAYYRLAGNEKSYEKAKIAYSSAKDSIAMALKLKPNNVEALDWQAFILIGQHEDSRDKFKKPIKSTPEVKQEIGNAIDGLRKAREIVGNNDVLTKEAVFENHLAEGMLQSYVGNYDQSITAFQAANKVIPRDPDLMRRMSVAYNSKGDYANALKKANEAIDLSDKDYKLYANKINILGAKDLKEALEFIRTTLKLDQFQGAGYQKYFKEYERLYMEAIENRKKKM